MNNKTTKSISPKLKKAFDWIEENLEYSRVFFHDDLYDKPTVEEIELRDILFGKPKNRKKGWKQLSCNSGLLLCWQSP